MTNMLYDYHCLTMTAHSIVADGKLDNRRLALSLQRGHYRSKYNYLVFSINSHKKFQLFINNKLYIVFRRLQNEFI